MKKLFIMTVVVFITAGVVMSGCSKDDAATDSSTDDGKIVAKIDDWTLTEEELSTVMETLNDKQRVQFDTPTGRAELVRKLMEEELYHMAGLEAGYGDDPSIEDAVAKYKRGLIVTAFYGRQVEPLAAPTEEELYDYYEANLESYTRAPIAKAQHIFSKNRDKLVELKTRIDEGEPMTTLAHKYSEDDYTKQDGGDLGYFNPGGYIRGIGYSDIISEVVFTMEPGVVSDPIKWEKGWSLIRVNELRPSQVQTFEEVRDQIVSSFVTRRIEDVKLGVYDELIAKHDASNYLAEELKLTERTPEELWNLAQNSSDSYQRLQYYQEVVNRYPDSKYAPQALFMVGFVQAEELKDLVEADRAFTRVVNRYPDSEVATSAQWMLENMNQPLPKFESLDELNEKIGGESD